ncbi:hypothetical protein SBE55_06080 [Mycolicibacterium sp. 141076]|uniref:hypothetical protein n=1 Tax=Mycobacteriaceae TaxID=1762 RepID=UPI00299EF4B5|nr:hypothetical protein [Mycolicibacterium sp. 141076]MDX1877382.1 hypothetical protein [Mycolicibacterium sp. 141076]
MTQPPQSGPWGAQPPQQPGNWQGYPGGQQGPGPQGQWNPQQQWPSPAPAPQKKGPLKWVLGAIALIAVIAVTAVVAVSCAGGNGSNNGGDGGTPSSGSKSDIASANDTGPVSVITEDPSCAPWLPVNNIVGDAEKNGWQQRDVSLPASAWTPETQSVYKAVGDAMRTAADQTVPLAKLTPHRVLRELYEQYIAYTRLFVDHIPTYTEADNNILGTAATTASVINSICTAISSGSAATRGPLVAKPDQPRHPTTTNSVDNPQQFVRTPDSQCNDWNRAAAELTTNPVFMSWLKVDSNISAGNWSAEDKSQNDAVKPLLARAVDSYEQLARQASNSTIEDFGMLAVQYGRAFIQGLPTYIPADINLYMVFLRSPGIIKYACQAAEAK